MSSTMTTASVSPSKTTTTTLQRSNATFGRHQYPMTSGNASSAMIDDSRGRGRADMRNAPPSPGKENHPLPLAPFGTTQRVNKYGAIAAHNPQHKHSKPRGRSVSPSKVLRLRSGSSRAKAEQTDEGSTTTYEKKSPREVDQDFLEMISDMQVPSALIHKLMALDVRVKESMVKGQATLSLSSSLNLAGAGKERPALSDRFMRSKSSVTLGEHVHPHNPPTCTWSDASDAYKHTSSSSSSVGSSSSQGYVHVDGASLPTIAQLASASSTSLLSTARSRSGSFAREGHGMQASGSAAYATMLKANDAAHLDIGKIKKMRAVLSSESPSWLEDFFDEGGYRAMVVRLQEILHMEWREEQHDDQLLHELLRCFVALSSTECGRHALASDLPTPFHELCDLLFSEKRPGELTTRKMLVELLCVLPDLPAHSSGRNRESVNKTREHSPLLTELLAQKQDDHFVTLLTLLHNQRDPTKEAVVDFITASHTPRPFKTWILEMLNVNRDYFWVFCHSSNRFWSLDKVDVGEAQGPKVPGGMTGGVEFEAMTYLTAHFRLINLVARRAAKLSSKVAGLERLALDFHASLFASGFERALAMTRKASQTYYQAVHLEMARYFDLCRRSGFRIPIELEAWQISPQLLPSHPIAQDVGAKESTNPPTPVASSPFRRDLPAVTTVKLGLPLFNPHEAVTNTSRPRTSGGQGSMVGDAVRKWEERTVHGKKSAVTSSPSPIEQRANNGGKTDDSAFIWMPPKEWS